MPRVTELWILPVQGLQVDELVGYDVEATDGHIGKIDHVTAETDRNFVVVDTGFWIFGKKRLIPAGMIELVDNDKRKVYLVITKEQVKSAPDFDEKLHTSYDETYYDHVGGYYGGFRGW